MSLHQYEVQLNSGVIGKPIDDHLAVVAGVAVE